jgi:hypothetical protein
MAVAEKCRTFRIGLEAAVVRKREEEGEVRRRDVVGVADDILSALKALSSADEAAVGFMAI